MRLANLFSVSIGSSTEHERKMLPTDMSDDDGSNRSNTSKSESESRVTNSRRSISRYPTILLLDNLLVSNTEILAI